MKIKFTPFQRAMSLLVLCFSLNLNLVQAQLRVGQPAASPDPSAVLDVSGGPYANGSTYRGIAPPKVALTQSAVAAPVTNPATGLLVYNTAKTGDVTPGYYYWEGSRWLRFSTSTAGAARVAALGAGQFIPAYKLSEINSLTTTSDNIILVEPGREGLFRYDASDTTTPNDNALVLVGSNNKRYKRVINDGRITPQMFGAVGDSLTDDFAALNAWLQRSAYEHFLPPGKYRSSQSLIRTDKGHITIKGAGERKSGIYSSGTTGGLIITNHEGAGPSYGSIVLTDFSISSVSTKSPGEVAIRVESGNLQRPGPRLENISVFSQTPGQEWTKAIQIYNSSVVSAKRIYVQSASSKNYTGLTTGIAIEGDTNRATVEINLSDISINGCKTGIGAYSTGNPGLEGLKIYQSNLVGVTDGIILKNAYSTPNAAYSQAPDFIMEGTHVNTYGGRCLYVEGVANVSVDKNIFFTNAESTTAVNTTEAVLFKNVQWAKGNIFAALFNNVPIGVKLTGYCHDIDLDIQTQLNFTTQTTLTVGPNCFRNIVGLNCYKPAGTGRPMNDSSDVTRLKYVPVGFPTENAEYSNQYTVSSFNGILDMSKNLSHNVIITQPSTVTGVLANRLLSSYQDFNISAEAPIIINHNTNITTPTGSSITLVAGERATVSYFASRWNVISVARNYKPLNPNLNLLDLENKTVSRRILGFGQAGETEGNTLSYNSSNDTYKAIDPYTTGGYSSTYVTTSTTINPNVHNLVTVYVTSGNSITISIDYTKFRMGQRISFIRFDNTSIGSVTLQNVNNGAYIQDVSRSNYLNVSLATGTSGTAEFFWNGSFLARIR